MGGSDDESGSGDGDGRPELTNSSVPPSTTTTTEPDRSLPAPADRPGPLFGLTVRNGDPARLQAIEDDAQVDVHLVRIFARWDTDPFDTNAQRFVDEGRVVHLSIRPRLEGGQIIAWRDIATARPGSLIATELTAWADAVAALGDRAYITLSHEPEARESKPNGNAADFKAAWRRFVEILDERGATARTVWTMTQGSFSDERADLWYPGNDVVDIVGVDTYNWFTCQGTQRPWTSFEDLLTEPLAFARKQGKPLAIPEFATAADARQPNRRAEWIRAVADALLDPSVSADIEFAAWFNPTAPDGNHPNCFWERDRDPASRVAFRDLIRTMTGIDSEGR